MKIHPPSTTQPAILPCPACHPKLPAIQPCLPPPTQPASPPCRAVCRLAFPDCLEVLLSHNSNASIVSSLSSCKGYECGVQVNLQPPPIFCTPHQISYPHILHIVYMLPIYCIMHIVSSYFAYYANSANSADICIKYILSMYDICCIYMYILTILLLCPTAGAREMLQRLRGGGSCCGCWAGPGCWLGRVAARGRHTWPIHYMAFAKTAK